MSSQYAAEWAEQCAAGRKAGEIAKAYNVTRNAVLGAVWRHRKKTKQIKNLNEMSNTLDDYYKWVRTLKVGDRVIYVALFGEFLVKVRSITPKKVHLISLEPVIYSKTKKSLRSL